MRFMFKDNAIGSLSLEGQNFAPDADGVFEIPGALDAALVSRYRGEIVPPPTFGSDVSGSVRTIPLDERTETKTKRSDLLGSTAVKG